MEAQDIMTKNPTAVSPDTKVTEAAKKMLDLDTGFLPIIDNNKVVGTITDRDIVIRAIATNKDPNEMSVKEIMTAKSHHCFNDDSLDDVAKAMCEKQIHRLMVYNHNDEMVGVISLADLSTKCGSDTICGHVIKEISENR